MFLNHDPDFRMDNPHSAVAGRNVIQRGILVEANAGTGRNIPSSTAGKHSKRKFPETIPTVTF